LAQLRAEELGLNMQFEVADLNSIELPARAFDLVFCHASLHHVIALERLAIQIVSSLKTSGELIIVDIITQNGYQMWPETRQIVRTLFRLIPARFRLNHTAYAVPRIDDDIWEGDTSLHSMECIRSQELLPALAKYFVPEAFVPYFSISRRFLDTMYGPNYDLGKPLDMALANWIWELDTYSIDSDLLLPETFFGIFRPSSGVFGR
jgi:SAM-dependent methyltransferase